MPERIAIGRNCLLNTNNEPQWFVLYHELGHCKSWHMLGIEPNYDHFRGLWQWLYGETFASLNAIYSIKEIVENNTYNYDQTISKSLEDVFNWLMKEFPDALNESLNAESSAINKYPLFG